MAKSKGSSVASSGVSFGCALAMVISYVKWQSIGWAILHGFLGWIYVIYYWITYAQQGGNIMESSKYVISAKRTKNYNDEDLSPEMQQERGGIKIKTSLAEQQTLKDMI